MTEVKISFLEAGACMHPEATVIQGGSWRRVRFGASVAVIEHPTQGVILFDTGYSPRFFEETRKLPERAYAWLTPVDILREQTALAQLARGGLSPSDVRHIVVSHFHADHIGGLADFPRARFIHRAAAFDALRDRGRFARLLAGFLPGLLPADFETRARPVGDGELKLCGTPAPFDRGFDLFGDGSIVLVELDGHAPGHAGLFVRGADADYFLVADACWVARAFQTLRLPSPLASLIIDDRQRYRETLDRIRGLSEARPALRVVPCHCAETGASLPRWRP